MAVFDTMRYIKSDVSTVCVGLAASMGAFILASGQKVSFLLCPNRYYHMTTYCALQPLYTCTIDSMLGTMSCIKQSVCMPDHQSHIRFAVSMSAT